MECLLILVLLREFILGWRSLQTVFSHDTGYDRDNILLLPRDIEPRRVYQLNVKRKRFLTRFLPTYLRAKTSNYDTVNVPRCLPMFGCKGFYDLLCLFVLRMYDGMYNLQFVSSINCIPVRVARDSTYPCRVATRFAYAYGRWLVSGAESRLIIFQKYWNCKCKNI